MEKDEKKALKWLLISAEQKNPDSMCILGELYMNGTPGLELEGSGKMVSTQRQAWK